MAGKPRAAKFKVNPMSGKYLFVIEDGPIYIAVHTDDKQLEALRDRLNQILPVTDTSFKEM